MEGAEATEVLSGLLQLHVFADYTDNVGLLLYAIRECSSFRQCRFASRLRRLASGVTRDNFTATCRAGAQRCCAPTWGQELLCRGFAAQVGCYQADLAVADRFWQGFLD